MTESHFDKILLEMLKRGLIAHVGYDEHGEQEFELTDKGKRDGAEFKKLMEMDKENEQ